MTPLILKLQEPFWPELKDVDRKGQLYHIQGGGEIGLLKKGTVNGNDVVFLRIDLQDGRVLVWETTYALFEQAARVLAIKHKEGK